MSDEGKASELLRPAVEIAAEAGRAALAFYGDPGRVDYKEDRSPLTRADRASNALIARLLTELTAEIPVLSEESPAQDASERRGWKRFWLVDPLDGSKEFLKRSGEFTINIALVRGRGPVLGVIHVPVTGVTYTALNEPGGPSGAWVEGPGRPRAEIRARRADLARPVIVASRDHAGPRVEAFLERVPEADVTSMGSSLKFCLVAEGKADLYPRIVPTMEWDTGAAQCVVEAAGGAVVDLDGRPLVYNKDDLRNPPLLAYGDRSIDWVRFFSGRG